MQKKSKTHTFLILLIRTGILLFTETPQIHRMIQVGKDFRRSLVQPSEQAGILKCPRLFKYLLRKPPRVDTASPLWVAHSNAQVTFVHIYAYNALALKKLYSINIS